MAARPEIIVADIGRKLAQQTRISKDFIVKSLRQAASALSDLDQLSSLKPAIWPLIESLVKHGLLKHKDKDVRLLVAICFSEILRVLAPDPSLSDNVFREVFELFVSMFMELADVTSPYFSKRVKILETVAALECCQGMLDIGSGDLILDMFHTFFSVVRDEHPRSLLSGMLSIMTLILKEGIDQRLLEVILQNLRNKGEGPPPASYSLAVDLIQTCEGQVKPAICGFLTSCILARDSLQNEIQQSYHEIIFELFQCAPQMLLAIIPSITQELLVDEVDVRIKSVNLIGKLLVLLKDHYAQEHHHLFVELMKRFSDKVAEVRISVMRCAKVCYLANPSATESHEILSSLEDRLLDIDCSVRMEAVSVLCDIARTSLKNFPAEIVVQMTERLRDKMTSVRKEALKKLLEIYHHYCSKCFEDQMTLNENFEQIPCKILMLCYDNNLKEFRLQNLELFLSEDMFPNALPVEERTRHWIFLYSLFTPAHVKAFNSILCQKGRFQTEMRGYLSLRKEEKENVSEKVIGRIKVAFKRMSSAFPDPIKTEELFDKLSHIKESSIFDGLMQLLDEAAFGIAVTVREIFLKKVGDKHPCFKFLEALSAKCINNIFGSEHVHHIVGYISSSRCRDHPLEASSVDLLLVVINNFPSLLRGSENQFKMLILENDFPFSKQLIQILAKAAPFISLTVSDIYPSLERWCLKGNRAQRKPAISAIADFKCSSKQLAFVDLCQKLVESLHKGRNVPTVLKSLGCIAHHSVLAFQSQEEEIISYIKEKIFEEQLPDDPVSLYENTGYSVSFNCRMKIYGLKTLVKGFLENEGAHGRLKINNLLDILIKMLQNGEFTDDSMRCESDKAHIRLAAAKSVLQLSGRWDLHIPPQMFLSTVMMAKDSLSFIRRLFIDKIHKLLKKHMIPIRYACAFSLALSDCLKDLQNASFNYLIEFIKNYSRAVRIKQTSLDQGRAMLNYPAYVVVFLLHVLAHDPGFPPENCQDREVYVQFFRPFASVLHALVNAEFVDGDIDLIKTTFLYLRSIFRAVKLAEDAVDSQKTPKLHVLADIGISVLNAMKHDGVSLALSPVLVLLPSSLYRNSLTNTFEEAKYCPIGIVFDENFVGALTEKFQSEIGQPATTVVQCGQKDGLRSNIINKKIVDSAMSKQSGSLMNELGMQKDRKKMETTVGPKISADERHKSAYSPCSPVLRLQDDRSTIEELETDGSGNPRTVPRKEPPVFDSLNSELSGIESETLTQELVERKRKVNSYYPETDFIRTKITTSGSSKGSAASFSQQCDHGDHSLDSCNETVIPLADAAVRKQAASLIKGKVLLDRTNSLRGKGLTDFCQQRKRNRGKGIEDSGNISASQAFAENNNGTLIRTRRQKA
ncbi:hypothetical protein Nepgr_019010 [Nepenthes gracilis]|uniref:Sister chromatid cohesion protein PDS5 homolog A n=1 Tax=Nepenthes gracilis TaxID=150966 RepID=A0AAD3SUN5_NEPGR|nr:hypothetical protein Nepgr_019010 [Nepenthes gracilis]